MESKSHPDLARLIAFARGLLTGADASVIETHLLDCGDCADRLVTNETRDKLVDGVRSVLADSAWRSWGVPAPSGPPATPGTLLAGRYRLLKPIGEGGMGAVWIAEQEQPVRRPVAVKLIKAGMDSKAVLARFESERQTLAMMDHPNIARVLDGGLTGEGRPFFVMELVTGVPITKYCDDRKLPPRERLELFIPVCRAIQHAHQKGIIHRDIKPGNVLVTEYDSKPMPKVIDFGVAKATASSLSGRSLATASGGLIGTPEYMSPEQAGLDEQDIDTRSDVYALGVLLYELLTGSPPFSWADLERRGLLEVLRVIREVDPPKPSTRVSTADAPPAVAANRQSMPAQLTRQIRGDLDWITMKALDKDRDRRYATANSLAEDVARYLNGQPIDAAPPSLPYRAGKFIRRNRGPVLAAALLVGALIAGTVGTSIGLMRAGAAEGEAREQARVANAERERADAAAAAEREARRLEWQTHLQDSAILAQLAQAYQANDQQSLKRLLSGKEAGFGNWIDHSKIDEPAMLLQVRDMAATVALEMKNEAVAVRQGEAVRKLAEEQYGSASAYVIRAWHRLADIHRGFDHDVQAQECERAAEAAYGQLTWSGLSVEHWHGIGALARYYANHRRQQKPKLERSIELLKRLVATANSFPDPKRLNHFSALHQLAWVEWYAGRNDDAFRDEKSVLLGVHTLKEDAAAMQLASDAQQLFVNLNRVDDDCLTALHSMLGPDRIHLGILAMHGFSLLSQSNWAGAEPVLRDVLARREKLEPDLWTTFNSQSMLGGSLLGQHRYEDAEPLLVAGYEGMKQRGDKIPASAKIRLREAAQRLVELYEATNRHEKADPYRRVANP